MFCLLLPRADFDALRARSPEFGQFCTEALATIVQHSLGQLRNHFSQRATDQQTLLEPLKSLVRRDPVFCSTDTPVRTALERMSEEGVRTIAVIDAQAPAGRHVHPHRPDGAHRAPRACRSRRRSRR